MIVIVLTYIQAVDCTDPWEPLQVSSWVLLLRHWASLIASLFSDMIWGFKLEFCYPQKAQSIPAPAVEVWIQWDFWLLSSFAEREASVLNERKGEPGLTVLTCSVCEVASVGMTERRGGEYRRVQSGAWVPTLPHHTQEWQGPSSYIGKARGLLGCLSGPAACF